MVRVVRKTLAVAGVAVVAGLGLPAAPADAETMAETIAGTPRSPAAQSASTIRVSVSTGGTQSNNYSNGTPSLSGDGRYVAFDSHASNLVGGDYNGAADVFVRDRVTGVTSRVSVGAGGAGANGHSGSPSISADGRYVAFMSVASNLVAGDTNGDWDVFVRDRVAGTTTRVSVGSGGVQANLYSGGPSLSADGRYVAFYSYASNLVPGDTNAAADVFVRDRVARITSRVSVGPGGAQASRDSMNPSISADGRFVAFDSSAGNLVWGDSNGERDVFVRDRLLGTTGRVSIATGGGQGVLGGSSEPSLSATGRYIAFYSYAKNLVPGVDGRHIFVRDRGTGTTTLASVGAGGVPANHINFSPAISANGRFVAFQSYASNLVPGDTNNLADVFLRDRVAGVTSRESLTTGGVQASNMSYGPAISADGRYLAFSSSAPNLVPRDTNGEPDVFLRRKW